MAIESDQQDQEFLAALALPEGLVWVCRGCPMQGRLVHTALDSARHDAAGHAIGVHRDRVALADITLRLVGEEDVTVRAAARHPGDVVALMPPVEDAWNAPALTDLQQDLVCEALGCAPDARHRRRRGSAADAVRRWSTKPVL
ncbi:hypothetical protein [Streptomyces sp. NPDC060366]|uniref:hypothetical protein n=1 Tax=Streptomyces sp. NPDC060366 TaxID=3347105 RepID=UPI0036627520